MIKRIKRRNEDIYKANKVNALVNAKTPYIQISVGSPTSLTKLQESASAVGAKVVVQINHPNDPVANGFVNGDANYEIKGLSPVDDLLINHPFDNYYNEGRVKEKIQEVINE